MSPSKFPDTDEVKRAINGPRPSPLRINRDSHVIRKHASSSNVQLPKQQNLDQQRPLIIYTHSPKIIHTEPRDFMALVQKLTGRSRSRDGNSRGQMEKKGREIASKCEKSSIFFDGEELFPSGKVKKYENAIDDVKENGSRSSLVNKISNANRFLTDIPMFTPNSTNLFCSTQPLHFQSPTVANALSPSLLELLKGLPEY